MADPIQSGWQKSGRAVWPFVAAGGLLLTLGGLLMLPARKVFLVRADLGAPPPVVTEPDTSRDQRPKTAFEPTDWSLAPVALIYFGTLVLLVVSCFVLIAAYPRALPDVGRMLRIAPPGPHLQTNAEGDLQRFRAEENRRLNTYYWIDKQKGLVHIPIEQAMKKLVSTGAPGFPKAQP
jgi:hypothetical protein